MCCFSRSILRWGLIAGLGLGGLTLLVGPGRVMAGFDQVRAKAMGAFDSCLDDPVALRRQLQSLADQYPDRLAQVEGELAEVERQIELLTEDTEVAKRVVSLTTKDLTDLKTLITRAEDKSKGGMTVAIRTGGVQYGLKEAHSEAVRLASVRSGFQERTASNEQQIVLLNQQKQRLTEIRNQIETEYADFETKLVQLDRQIDAIERNERLIEMTKEQRALLASYEKFGKVGNLTQLEGKLAELRRVQEAQLQTLAKSGVNRDYERRARAMLQDDQAASADPFFDLEIGPPAPETEEVTPVDDSVAWAAPLVIED
jgi:hypothetical protein